MSAFIKSGEFEVDATPRQRIYLFRATGIKTDWHATDESKQHLMPKMLATRLGMPWLSMGKASQLINSIGKLSQPNVEAIKEAREYLKTLVQGDAEYGTPKAVREDTFTKLYAAAENAAEEAFNNAKGDGQEGLCWVLVSPGTVSFARWLKEKGYGEACPMGGIAVWCKGEFSKALAYANAFAECVNAAQLPKTMLEVQFHKVAKKEAA